MRNGGSIGVHGHRGARAVLPENTLQGFRYAIAAGADAIEMDIAVTRDDVPMVTHDPWIGVGRIIRSLGFEQLRRAAPSIPTLEEVLMLASLGDFLFNIELKSFPRRPKWAPAPERFAELVWALVETLAPRVMVQSFDFRTLHAMRGIAPALPLGALFERGQRDFVAVTRRAQADIAVPKYRLVTSERVAAAHAAGIRVYTWTVNRPKDWQCAIEAGVDAIITDDPAALLRYLAQR